MRIAATWKPRWTRVTSARMVMRRDRVLLQLRCRSWSITKSMKLVRPHEHGSLALLKLWRFVRQKKLFDHFESPTRPPACDPSSTLATRLRAFVVPGTVMYISSQRSWAFPSRWCLGPCGCFSSAFRRLEQDVLPFFFQRCYHAMKGREKQLMAAMGAEHWELTFKSAWLNCPAWRSRSSPTAEKFPTLTHVGAVSGVCGLSPVSAMKFCRTVPSTEARKSMTMSNTLMTVATECVHACVHRSRRLDKKKKESDVNFYLFSKYLESGNVDNCFIWS